ncbi:hypothetical protein BKA82DRAFT_4214489 [Pisolithus tinctorius]|nr:hypothetical protein BKA82DRAFT_4214489 [Pisolithus tinctorius]
MVKTNCSLDVSVSTSDLVAARAELTRLQNRERELLEELRSVRTAAQAQMDRINGFVKRRLPAPITRLPLSVLSDIIHRTICNTHPVSDAHRCTKRELASVSRCWRDAILNCPKLWTTIVIGPSWSAPLVIAHVKRSGECPLDIIITKWNSMNQSSRLKQLLGATVTCGYRWRSLVIRENNATLLFENIQYMMFPALKRVEISGTQFSSFSCPLFLTSHYAPALEQMKLLKGSSIDRVPNVTNLRSVYLYLDDEKGMSGSLLLSSLLPIQQLSELGLSGTSDEWPDAESICLPVLTSLTLTLSDPWPALGALVTPGLLSLACSEPKISTQTMRRRGCPWAHAFRDFPKKFATVQRLCLSDSTSIFSTPPETTALGAQAVCAACPGVRRAELPANMMDVFFVKDNAPADLWQDLRGLTFRGLTTGTIPREFVRWLVARESNHKHLLQVTFSEFKTTDSPDASGFWPGSLYEQLHSHCKLKLKGIPLKATLNMDSLMDTRGTSSVYDSPGMVKTRYLWCCHCYDSARSKI